MLLHEPAKRNPRSDPYTLKHLGAVCVHPSRRFVSAGLQENVIYAPSASHDGAELGATRDLWLLSQNATIRELHGGRIFHTFRFCFRKKNSLTRCECARPFGRQMSYGTGFSLLETKMLPKRKSFVSPIRYACKTERRYSKIVWCPFICNSRCKSGCITVQFYMHHRALLVRKLGWLYCVLCVTAKVMTNSWSLVESLF